jgi:hypothetical protein
MPLTKTSYQKGQPNAGVLAKRAKMEKEAKMIEAYLAYQLRIMGWRRRRDQIPKLSFVPVA